MPDTKPKTVVGFFISRQHCISSYRSMNRELRTGIEILEWLSEFSTRRNVLNVFWDLESNVAALLSKLSLSINQLQELFDETKLQITNEITITYIVGKYFSIKNGCDWDSPYAMFSDASQYSTVYLQEGDLDYAFKCACEARDIGIQVRDSLALMGVDNPATLISPINAFMKRHGSRFQFPTGKDIDDIDPKIGEYYLKSMSGGWFENFFKGHFQISGETGGLWDYDVRSCYSSLLATLPDIREGKFSYVEGKMTDAPLGVYKCNTNVTSNFSAINHRIVYNDNNYNFTPMGQLGEKYLVRQTVDDTLQYKTGQLEIIDGYEWRPTKGWKPIYLPLMKRLYELKEANEGIKRDVIKRVSNALWGITAQIFKKKLDDGTTVEKFGDNFMSMYASLVENHCRSKMFRTAMDNGIIPVVIQMDGMATRKPLTNISIGDKMGDWKLVHANKSAIAVNADICAIKDKTNSAVFGVEYDWIVEEVEKNPEASRYTMTRNSCVTVGKVLQNPHLLGQLGCIIPTSRSIDLNIEFKRVFPDHPKNGRELLSGKIYESQAPDISMIDPTSLPDIDDTLLTSVG